MEAYQKPTILTGNGPTLTIDSIISKLPGALPNVYVNDKPVFPYFDSVVAKLSSQFKAPYNFTNQTVREIFGADSEKSDSKTLKYYYFSGSFQMPHFQNLRNGLNLSLLTQYVDRTKRIDDNIWMGGSGVVASAHYDATSNLFLQVTGTKKFSFTQPKSALQLGVFGRYHPRSCQSRIAELRTGRKFQDIRPILDWTGGSSTEVQAHGNCSALDDDQSSIIKNFTMNNTGSINDELGYEIIDIVLKAGEILYIPPFWFHEVVTVEASLSLSFWQDAFELYVMDEIYSLPLPLEEDWREEDSIAAVIIFCSNILRSVDCILRSVPKDSIESLSDQEIESLSLTCCRARTCKPSCDGSSNSDPNEVILSSQAFETSTEGRVVSLMIRRYKEDWMQFLNLKEAESLYADQRSDYSRYSRYLNSMENCEVDGRADIEGKSRMYSMRHAKIFLKMVVAKSSRVNSYAGETPYSSAEDSDDYWIMCIKLADYIEDVFKFVSHERHVAYLIFDWIYSLYYPGLSRETLQ